VFNTYLTTGTGTAQPNGVVTAATASGVTAAASALDRDDLIDLIHSVDIAYRNSPGSRLMFSDSTLAAIKKLTVGSADDRPLWSPSMREGEPDRIDGVPYVINNDMASIGTGNISVLYGDFQKYCVRLVKGIQMVRLNELYAANRSVGFFAFARMDGELLDSKALKSLVHA
jgi:HK97 family phage major capsid protein